MKYIFMLLIAGFFAASPVYLVDHFVLAELDSLADSYRNADVTAQNIANSGN